jgi:ABC-type multidrug transport system fused ATPase/permease subunit
MFNTSTRENILFGVEFTDSEVIGAVKLAHAHEFILGLTNGYDNLVGRNNGSLLPGQ